MRVPIAQMCSSIVVDGNAEVFMMSHSAGHQGKNANTPLFFTIGLGKAEVSPS